MRISFARRGRSIKTKIGFVSGLLTLLAAVGIAAPVYAACDTNDVMYCGYSSPSDFISQVKADKDKYGRTGIQAAYNAFGFSSSSYDRFVKTAKPATIYKDGRVVVNGKTVMTGAYSWGRNEAYHSGAGMQVKTVGSTKFYGNTTSRSFASDSLSGHVMFNSSGKAEFVVLSSCANPITGNPEDIGVRCDMLTANQTKDRPNNYELSTKATTIGNAKITKYVYDFGDGKTRETTSGSLINYTYAKPGTYEISVTVYATTPSGELISAKCKKTVTVPKPVAQCVSLVAAVLNKQDNSYTFTTTAKYTAGAKLESANFNFGDGKTSMSVKPANATTVTTTHSYAKAGNYKATATLNFSIYGSGTTNHMCQTDVSVIVPFYSCVELKGPEPNGLTYTLVATGKFGNGAKLVSGDFTYGDGKVDKDIAASGTTVTTKHTYAQAGTYSASALLKFTVDGKTVYAKESCTAVLKPNQPPTPECKPGIPVGDSRCNPCEYDANLPADDERCVPPVTSLPNTGAGNVVAVTSAALIGGFLLYRHLLFRKHKAAFMAADAGTSPLPLGDPLESAHPLAGTPLEAQTRSRLSRFRRRQF
jgi:hypothetical protein